MKRFAIITVLIIFLLMLGKSYAQNFLYPDSRNDQAFHNIYLINQYWHTGILLRLNDKTKELLPILKLFEGKEYVDIGWGDEEFYQSTDFDLYLAAKAILYPTPSVVRIEGYKSSLESIVNWSNYTIKLKLGDDGLQRLADFINKSFKYDSTGNFTITANRAGGSIIFFKSRYKYHLFYTCNTWAAEAFFSAGLNIDPSGVVTAEQLFSKLKKFGEVLKAKE